MAKTIYEVLIEKINECIVQHQEHLIDGGAKDYASYKEVCGVIRGLATALQEIKDLARNQMELDEDE